MNVWTLTTCIPGDAHPVIPQVFLSAEKAEEAFKNDMRGEWTSNGPVDEFTVAPLPFPEHLSAQEIHDLIAAAQPDDRPEPWGRYILMHHRQEG